jgi:ABC-type amino acid transport substrate-binding protein
VILETRRVLVAICLFTIVATGCAAGTPGTVSPQPSPTARQTRLEQIRAAGQLMVAIRREGPPGGRTAQDPAHGQKRAFEIGLADLIARRLIGENARIEHRDRPGRAWTSPVEQGQVDLAFGLDDASTTSVAVSDPFASGGVALASRATVSTLADLRGQRAVVPAMDEVDSAEVLRRRLREAGVEATVATVESLDAAFAEVAAGRAFAAAGDRVATTVLLRAGPPGLVAGIDVARAGYVAAVRKDAPELLNAINAALRALRDSGELQRLADRSGFPLLPR